MHSIWHRTGYQIRRAYEGLIVLGSPIGRVGCKNGTEAIIHSVASCMENLNPEDAILQVDFSNAFNCVRRERVLELVQLHLPQLENIVRYLYANTSFLIVGGSNETIESSQGVQQGCPMAPLLFALVLKELTSEIDQFNVTLNMWFLDDGHIVGKKTDLIKILELIELKQDYLGLSLNLPKCTVYGTELDIFPIQIRRAYEGLIVLGSPIGTQTFVKTETAKIVGKATEVLEKTKDLNDPQMQLLLLRCCTGAPKLIYWQRTCEPIYIAESIKQFDNAIDENLQHIFGVPLNGLERLTVHLPLSFGGLGIPIASLAAESAFVSSVGASWHLQPVNRPRNGFTINCEKLTNEGAILPQLNNKIPFSESPLLNQSQEFRQSTIMLKLNSKIRQDMRNTSNMKKEIILQGRSCKGASYWLTTPPNIYQKSVLDAAVFRALLKYSIGMKQFSGNHKCPDCGKEQDNYGHHALSCKVGSTAIEKHNTIVDFIYTKMLRAGISCNKEACNPMNDTRQRPGDIYMPEFDIYGEAFFDISVISICAPSYAIRASKGQLEGSKIRYEQKMMKYPDLGSRFKPMVMESTGGWNAFSFNNLKLIANHIAARTSKVAEDCLNDLLKGSSFCLQRDQGMTLVRRSLGLRMN